MTRFAFLICVAALCLFSVGCCGPMGCGVGCDVPMGCNDCDGLGQPNVVPTRPLDSLRNIKRKLVCGSGCGEAYIGEWISTPPDAQDPCCGDQFVGGATKCKPFCNPRGALLGGGVGFGGLLGGRFCTGAESSAPCGCGAATCGGSCGEVIDGGQVINEGYIETAVPASSSCGCATCSANSAVGSSTRIAGRIPVVDPMARRMDARVQRIRQ